MKENNCLLIKKKEWKTFFFKRQSLYFLSYTLLPKISSLSFNKREDLEEVYEEDSKMLFLLIKRDSTNE
jgi:hypothetical protein